MGAQLGNCPKCGKLYLRVRNICDDCHQKQENDFLKAAAHLRDHRGCTIQELSDATSVSVTQIRQFIWAGRIVVEQFPNLSYPCESCGNPIQSGRKCNSCLNTLQQLSTNSPKTETTANASRGLRFMTRTNNYDKHK